MGTPGKSGSLFFFSLDNQYVLKTIPKREAKILRDLLPAYYRVCLIKEREERKRRGEERRVSESELNYPIAHDDKYEQPSDTVHGATQSQAA